MRSKQIPTSYTLLALMVAILAALFVLGKLAPESAADAQDRKMRTALSVIKVPEIEGTTSDGKPFHLTDYKGKVILLNFWATWCGPCRMEIPDLIALQEKYGPKGFVVVGLADEKDPNPDSAVALIKKFAEDSKLNYPVLLLPEGIRNEFGGIAGLPTSFLIDRNGKVVYGMEGLPSDKAPKDIWIPEIEKVL
jgi:thiol-disulfide isomerase/thioredoxin